VFLEKERVVITQGRIFGDDGNQDVRVSLCSKKGILEEAIDRVRKTFTKQ